VKHSKNGTILVPQPSDDPSDPLNWPLWRRDLITLILCLLSVIASTLSPLLAANTLTLTLYFGRSFTDIALLTGYHLLGVGVAGFIFVASARVWGKRHLYLLGTVVIIISSAWGGGSNKDYNSLMAARFFQGVGLAPFEALVNASVGDLYFVHERGARMALSNLSLFGGAFFTPVIVGKLTHTLGWQWSFYLLAIFTGAMLPLVIFFVPETAYVREDRFNTDMSGGARDSEFHKSGHEMQPSSGSISLEKGPDASSGEPINGSAAPPKLISKATLMPFNGRKTNENFFKLLLRPFPLFLHPGIFWACLIQGAMIGWTVLIGIVLAAIMLGPPLWFNEVQTGYMYTGAFIGAILGFALAGLISDPAVKWMTKWNGGIYEPEFRLILVIPQLIFGCAGLYGFGITANDTPRYGWFWPDFFFALEVMGMVLGAVASALYIVDAHREIAVEGFTCLLVFKNIFSFGLTYSGYDWLVSKGIKPVFVAISSVQVGVCCLTVLMCKSSLLSTTPTLQGMKC
jgi:MFS family permease